MRVATVVHSYKHISTVWFAIANYCVSTSFLSCEMAARIVHVPAADAPVIAIYKSGILPEHEGYKYFVPAQSEDQRRRRVKHQLAVDQLECSFFYTSYSQKSLLGLKRNVIH